MRVDWTGRIVKGFYVLGHPSVPMYLMDGELPALFDTGFTGLADHYLADIRAVLKKRTPAFLFITHAHWDHVGCAGIFKREWPAMKIVASETTRSFLRNPKIVETLTRLNEEAKKALEE